MTFRIYLGRKIMAEGDSPLEITGLSQDTEYPAGTFEATRLENGRESERVDVPYFRTLYFADYEENDVELMLSVDGEETTGTYTILGMPQDKYVGGEHDENIVYAVQPDVAESGAVYFLGDTYVDRVVRDGEIVYGRNYLINSRGVSLVSTDSKNSLDNTFKDGVGTATLFAKEDTTLNRYAQYKKNLINIKYFSMDIKSNCKENELRIGASSWNNNQQGESSVYSDFYTRLSVWDRLQSNAITTSAETSRVLIRFNLQNTTEVGTVTNYKNPSLTSDPNVPYTVAPEDLFPSTSTFPSFTEWPEEDTEERI